MISNKKSSATKLYCYTCNVPSPVTFLARDIALKNHPLIAKKILSFACRICGTIIAMPIQSKIEIQELINEHKKAKKVKKQKKLN